MFLSSTLTERLYMALFKKKDKKKEEKEKPQKKPIEIWYTEDGTKIGDDGYPMLSLIHI